MFFISHAVKKRIALLLVQFFLYLLADREGWGNTPFVLGKKQRKLIVKRMSFTPRVFFIQLCT